MDVLLRHQSDLYWAAFLGSLIIAQLWEVRSPVRDVSSDRTRRWSVNLAFLFMSQLISYIAVPAASVALALRSEAAGWGLLRHLNLHHAIQLVLSVLAIDAAKYLQHYLLHRVPALWRIHRTHHADYDCDVTTSFRFHPLETLLSLLVEAGVILLLGVPAAAVVLYQSVRIAISALVHANVSFAPPVEKALRWLVVTPDIHRIHHSTDVREQVMNLSGGLIWWDRLLGTYAQQSIGDPRTMSLGLVEYDRHRANSLSAMLMDPMSR